MIPSVTCRRSIVRLGGQTGRSGQKRHGAHPRCASQDGRQHAGRRPSLPYSAVSLPRALLPRSSDGAPAWSGRSYGGGGQEVQLGFVWCEGPLPLCLGSCLKRHPTRRTPSPRQADRLPPPPHHSECSLICAFPRETSDARITLIHNACSFNSWLDIC